jgi:hypothetical protein
MMNWRDLSKDEQIAALQNVAGIKHIPPQAVEKDMWVTTILQILFSLPFADSLVFKSGTSLSKVFGKIERFSEDIDLAIDRTYFGLEGDLTKKQLKKLRKLSSTFVRDTFLQELQNAFVQHGLMELSAIAQPDGEGDSTYPEPRQIFIEYPSLFRESLDYIKPRIVLEIGSRSLIEPTTITHVQSLVEQSFPDVSTALVNPPIATAVAGDGERASLLVVRLGIKGYIQTALALFGKVVVRHFAHRQHAVGRHLADQCCQELHRPQRQGFQEG